jgi:PAS domain S-box-containing protein
MGPFATGTLLERMITLQAFDATVAFTSLFFAALVTERLRDREALERSAADLEERVRHRTRQLAEAQHLAHVGSWEWVIPDNRVLWSDEMYVIYGHVPQAFGVTFEGAMQQVVSEDLPRLRTNVEAALRARRDQSLPPSEFRILRPDGSERVLVGKSRLEVDEAGQPNRMVGTVQDITESKQAEREHRIAETLQRSLLPDRLPEIAGLGLAARYVPATADMEVGGDWYDVVQLPDGQVALAIGDVAGHGLRAASTMGQLRMAIRAYALEESQPQAVVVRAHQLVQRLGLSEMATLVYVLFDPESGSVRYSNAGHPPPLLVPPTGSAFYLEEALAPPLAAMPHPEHYGEATASLPDGSALLLFTDGLVERRDASLLDGLARLRTVASDFEGDLEALCDHLLSSLVGHEVSDDVAVLAMRSAAFAGQPLHVRIPAEPHSLAPLRHTLRRWLRDAEVEEGPAYQVLVACGEACANAIQHAYGAAEGWMEVDLSLAEDVLNLTVRDSGSWRTLSPGGGGRGLDLMRGLMDAVEVEGGSDGTVVRMRLRVKGAAGDRRSHPPESTRQAIGR